MNRERVKELLAEAALLAPSQRRSFIEHAADDDAAVSAEALELLQSLDDSVFLNAPTITQANVAALGVAPAGGPVGALTTALAGRHTAGPGTHIGRYKLLQQIGEGGFGTVFMAEQTEPVARRVALKIIKAGMDTRQVIARFEAERQALALMDHPNIAKVLDAGEHRLESGATLPYFVMELVRGEPITKYCDGERLSIERRLQLFADVCRAVQHAHQKGVIHRDIKPSNVLVTVADGEPLPKVIDFGVAKATASPLTDKTLFTEMHQLIGTPEYMSPEQADPVAVDIDTRSDVYSLGVLLYELLTGTTPFDRTRLKSAGLQGLIQIIREEEPPRPSTRLATLARSSRDAQLADGSGAGASSSVEIAHLRRMESPMLERRLRGDLDWIAMRCLEKDRRRRYETANAVAADVQRYLDGEPVLAAPPSRFYHARKLLRRHRGAALLATVIVGALVVSLAGVGTGFVRAEQARKNEARQREVAQAHEKDAVRQAARAERIREFLTDMFGFLDTRQPIGREVSVRTILDAATKRLDEGQLRDDPEIEADIRVELGDLYRCTCRDEYSAGRQYASATATFERVLGPSHRKTLSALHEVGIAMHRQGRYAEAEDIARRTLTVRQKEFGDEDPDTINSMEKLSWALSATRRFSEAEPLRVRAVELCCKVWGEDHPTTIQSIGYLGNLYLEQGRLAEAETQYREQLVRARRYYKDQDCMASRLGIADVEGNVAFCLGERGQIDEAVEMYNEALLVQRAAYGDRHRVVARTLSKMGAACTKAGLDELAEAALTEALEILRDVAPGEDAVAWTLFDLGMLRAAQNRLSDAEVFMREGLEIRRKLAAAQGKNGDPWSLRELAGVLGAQGKQQEADELNREATQIETNATPTEKAH